MLVLGIGVPESAGGAGGSLVDLACALEAAARCDRQLRLMMGMSEGAAERMFEATSGHLGRRAAVLLELRSPGGIGVAMLPAMEVNAFVEATFAQTRTESELEPFPHSNSDLNIGGIKVANPVLLAPMTDKNKK